VLITSVGLVPSGCAVLWYMLVAHLFPWPQLISHRVHTVLIMTTVSSASVCFSQSTQCASCDFLTMGKVGCDSRSHTRVFTGIVIVS
jgi:hypothetical protein